MSIEQKIEALTLAVENLTKVIAGTATSQPAKVQPIGTLMDEEEAKITAKLRAEKPAPKVEAPKPEAPKPAAPAPEAPTVTYDDVKKAVTFASTQPGGRTKVVDLLARYGCAKATELRAETWAEFIKELSVA